MAKEDKNKKLILVVPRKILFGKNNETQFTGFRPFSDVDYKKIVRENYGFMTRGFAEEDPNYKQPIAYCMIVNPELEQVYVYQRSDKRHEYHESRLSGKVSIGVGGHIDAEDTQDTNHNPISNSMRREISEEIDLGLEYEHRTLGYINLEHDVHAVHFGILYLITTSSLTVSPKDKEAIRGSLMPFSDLEELVKAKQLELEGWSEVAFEPLKWYIDQKIC